MALLVPQTQDLPVRVLAPEGGDFPGLAALHLGAGAHAMPAKWQLDGVQGPDGKVRRFTVWVGAGVGEWNERATYAAHPLNLGRRRLVFGSALLVPAEPGEAFGLGDWEQIWRGVAWSEEHEELVEANAAGVLAEGRNRRAPRP